MAPFLQLRIYIHDRKGKDQVRLLQVEDLTGDVDTTESALEWLLNSFQSSVRLQRISCDNDEGSRNDGHAEKSYREAAGRIVCP